MFLANVSAWNPCICIGFLFNFTIHIIPIHTFETSVVALHVFGERVIVTHHWFFDARHADVAFAAGSPSIYDFSLDMKGKPMSLEAYRGQVSVSEQTRHAPHMGHDFCIHLPRTCTSYLCPHIPINKYNPVQASTHPQPHIRQTHTCLHRWW
jgi:hypothetical protein